MKRAAKAVIAVYFAVVMCIFSGINAFAWNVDTSHLDISFGEVPEGTVFADILVKGKWEENNMDFHVYNGSVLGVDENCELAKYNEDGYTSLFLKHKGTTLEQVDLSPESKNKHMEFAVEVGTEKLFNHYRHIKIAYCDKDGKILGTTNEVKVEKVTWGNPYYKIEANGSSLTCDVNRGPAYFMIVLVPVAFIFLAVILIAVIITAKLTRKAKIKNSIKRIQSGEVDNERKE
ncbi:MAG: hypothetical protein J6X85_02130 [Ruminococcus sp.]|nr:hypothetical protein [Ruminococcus sp.]